ncbi:MAG: recombinase family protein [Pseudomonadota bacterium]
MKTGFGYIRVSTQKQGEGVSLDAQRDAIAEFAASRQITIVAWFAEMETAAKGGRPVFNDMLRQLRRGKADALIMHKIDRSARNMTDWSRVSELPTRGVEIHFAGEGLDYSSRGGRLAANLQAVIAEDYIFNLREETIKGLRGRLKQGLYPFRAPIGYRDNGRGQPKAPCPEKAPLVRQVFELYASGRYSIPTLQAEMARRGLRNHAGKPVSKHGIETILNNPFYCGLIEIKRTGDTYDGVHEPITSAQTFRQVQEIKRGKAGKKVTRHNHLYRGLFRCAGCQTSMIPERQKGHVYYRCQRPDCPTNTVREDRLEAEIVAAYKRLQLAPDDAADLLRDWQAWLDKDQRREHLQSIDLRIAQTTERLARLTDLLLDGALDRREHDDRKRQLKIDLAALQEARASAAQSDLSDALLEKFLELITSLAELHIRLEPDEKRCLVENSFSNRTVSANRPVLEPYSWLTSRDFAELTPLVTQNGPLLELLSRLTMR